MKVAIPLHEKLVLVTLSAVALACAVWSLHGGKSIVGNVVFAVIFCMLAGIALRSTRFAVLADESGLTAHGFVVTRFVPWNEVVRVEATYDQRWARDMAYIVTNERRIRLLGFSSSLGGTFGKKRLRAQIETLSEMVRTFMPTIEDG